MFTSDRKRRDWQGHVSDEDVLRFADGELDTRRAAAIRDHFEMCWECRTRLIDIQNTIASFVHLHETLSEQAIPPLNGPLAQLKARLRLEGVESYVENAQAAGRNRKQKRNSMDLVVRGEIVVREFLKRRRDYAVRLFFLSAATVFVLLLLTTFLRHSNRGASAITPRELAKPLASLTPGQTVPFSRQQVCSSDPLTTARVPAPALRKRVFEEYGMANAQERNFEIDFLITPELGGAETVKNLWPEPYQDIFWNAHVKDRLEVRLRDLVCSGNLDLATAQRDLSSDWIAAYRRYFRSEMPIRNQTPAALLLTVFKQP